MSDGLKRALLELKDRLYIYVAADFLLALLAGHVLDFEDISMRIVGAVSVFIMLYPMLTGMEVERIKSAGRNFRLIISTLAFAYLAASAVAYTISRAMLGGYPDIAFALVMVGAIPCSNMLIGWSGIADASVEDALVIAVLGLLTIPFISPLLLELSGGGYVRFKLEALLFILLTYIFVPLIAGFLTRSAIIKKRGRRYFMDVRRLFPGISATGVLLIVFFSVAKVSKLVMANPIIFMMVIAGLISYYIVQTVLSTLAAKLLGFRYEHGLVLILGSTASSQAISLSVAATMFSALTVFALSFKPILQVSYILFLIYGLGPWLRKFLS